jgi:hypothetical protein
MRSRPTEDDTTTGAIGLCATCRHMEAVHSQRGSTFYRCGLSDRDPRFRRYPVLPVIACSGYARTDVEDESS